MSSNRRILTLVLLVALVAAAGARLAGGAATASTASSPASIHSEGAFPPLTGGGPWLNSPPLTRENLRGKVVLIDFWTYSCINCLRSLPYVKAWYEQYKGHGLVVIGVHAPEFPFEQSPANVRRSVKSLGILYPVVLDNDYAIWQAFNNQVWPAHYFIDAQGRIRSHHFGEGEYAQSEDLIRKLLAEAGYTGLPPVASNRVKATGVEAAADDAHLPSPETYIGYERAEHFSSPTGFVHDKAAPYAVADKLRVDQWGLDGRWIVRKGEGVLDVAPGRLVFRFRARDLHLVLGPGADGKPIHFRVLLDGAAPAGDRGMDIDAGGNGIVTEHRLYQLIRQPGGAAERTFAIEFLDPGVHAYSFTFG